MSIQTRIGAREVVFVDQNVDDMSTLLSGLRSDVQAFLLSVHQAAPRQIAQALSNFADLEAVHIISHGKPGEIAFAAGTLSHGALATCEDDLAAIGAALADHGELLLWSCHAGQGPQGARFIETLERLTGVPVFAAGHAIGFAARGGSWVLDGTDTHSPLTINAQKNYEGLMAVSNFSVAGGSDGRLNASDIASGYRLTYGLSNPIGLGSDVLILIKDAAGNLLYWWTDTSNNSANIPRGALGGYDGPIQIQIFQGTAQTDDANSGGFSGSYKSYPSSSQFTFRDNSLGGSNTAVTNSTVSDSTLNLTFDTTAPKVNGVAITGATGIQNSTLNAGDVVTIKVSMSEIVTVSGAPRLALNIGGTVVQANYASGSGSNELTFIYTILSGQNDTNGISIGTNALSLNGGSIVDAAGNTAVITSSSVIDNAGFKVDTVSPNAPAIGSVWDDAPAYVGVINNGQSTNDTTPTLRGTAEANSIVSIYDGANLLGTATTNGSGAWSFTTGVLASGNHVFTARAADAAGNVSAASSNFSITITGSNSAPVLGQLGQTIGYTEQAAAVVIDNNLTVADANNANLASATVTISAGRQTGDMLNFVNQNGISGSYNAATGTLTLTGSSSVANYQAALRSVTFINSTNDNPTAGGSAPSRTISWVANDGTANSNTGTSTINITAVNDAAVISGTSIGTVVEAGGAGSPGTPTATGTLTGTDVDNAANSFSVVAAGTASTGGYGTYQMTTGGVWTYTLDNANATVQALNNGQTLSDSFTVTSIDGTAKIVTVTINGTTDSAVIDGIDAGNVVEAGGVANGTAGTPTAMGTLTSANSFNAVAAGTASTGGYGTYQMNAGGQWTYTLNNGSAAVQSLNIGQTLTDTFTVTSTDGTPKVVTVTIYGTNDAATVFGIDTGNVVEAGGVANATLGTATATGTLAATDIDNPSNSFTALAATATTNGYGAYQINAAGQWAYTVNNSNVAVQLLNNGQTLTDSFTVTSIDGTPKTVTVTIYGANDTAVISGIDTGNVVEAGGVANGTAGSPTATGTLASTDIDNPSNSFTAVASATTSANGYGTYQINGAGQWVYTLNNGNAAVQALNNGQTLTDSFTVTSIDGTPKTVTVTINGANDAAVIGGTDTGSVVETGGAIAGTPTATGTLNATDVDNPGNSFTAVAAGAATANGYGTYQMTAGGQWVYTLNNGNAAVDALNTGQTLSDSFTVTSIDGTAKIVTVTINGTNDAAVIIGTSTGSVVEAGGIANGTPGTPTATGIVSTGIGFNAVVSGTASTGGYGTYQVTAGGQWTYTLNNSNATVQALNVGGTLTDTFTITATDGTPKIITVTISGTNDAAIISGVDTGNVAEAGGIANGTPGTPTATGTLFATDVDNPANSFNAVTTGGATTNGYGSYEINGTGQWTYTLNNGNATVQALNNGQTLTDSFTVTSIDGTARTVTVVIAGTNDTATISGPNTGAVVEAGGVANGTAGTPTATGTLAATDIDNPSNSFTAVASATTSANGYGTYQINGAGQWVYTLDNANPFVQMLTTSGTLSDSFTVTSVDGTTHVITVTITGTNDAPVITSAAQTGSVTEDSQLTATGQVTATDVDGGPAAYAGDASGSYGSFAVDAATGVWTYTLDNAAHQSLAAGETHDETFTVTVSDGNGGSASQTVTITVTGTNDGPILTGDLSAPINQGATYIITPTDLGFTDIDDLASGVTFTVSSQTHGTVQVNGVPQTTFTGIQLAAGQVTFAHDNTSTTTASFQVSVEDGNEDSSTPVASTFNLAVTLANQAPVAVDDIVLTNIVDGSGISIAHTALTANDTDFEGGPLSVTGTSGSTGGSVSNGPNSVTFTPTLGVPSVTTYNFAGVTDTTAAAGGHKAGYFSFTATTTANTPFISGPNGIPAPTGITLTNASNSQYDAIEAQDSLRFVTGDEDNNTAPFNSKHSVFVAEFDIAENPASISQLDFKIIARQTNTGAIPASQGLHFGIYNYATNAWEEINEFQTIADSTFQISKIGSNAANYINPNGKVDLALYNEYADSGVLETIEINYVELKVTAPQGFSSGAFDYTTSDPSAATDAGHVTITGVSGSTITGTAAAEIIIAGSGNDTIVGAQNDTLLDGGSGNDTLNVGANFTSTSNAQIVGIENVTLTTAATLNLSNQTEGFTISGSSGADSITGGSGNDTIVGGSNDALLNGGDGIDTLSIGVAFADTSDAQIVGIENVTLSTSTTLDLSDQLEGFSITGSSGADTITGGSGADTITGGAGVDSFQFGTNGSTVAAMDTIVDYSGDTLNFAGTEALLAAGGSAVAGTSVSRNASGLITFAAADDTLAERIAAAQADSALDAANTVAFFTFGSDAYVYSAGASAGNADDQIVKITGGSANTVLSLQVGGNGLILTSAQANADNVIYTSDNSGTSNSIPGWALLWNDLGATGATLGAATGHTGGLSATLSSGNYTVSGLSNGNSGTFAYTFTAGATTSNSATVNVTRNNSTTLNGGNLNDIIVGDNSDEDIVGGNGDDILIGNAGNDDLTGGAGADLFYVSSGTDTINDLGAGGTDIVLVQSGATANATATAAWTATTATNNIGTASINANGFNINVSAASGTSGWTLTNSNATGVTLTGSANNDTLSGGAGADTLSGGLGNDTYSYGASTAPAGENIVEAASGGTDTIRTTVSIDLSALTVNGTADLQGAGSLGIEQILIQNGTTANFSGVQLDGNSIAINETTTGTTTLVINVASGATNSFANLTFAGFSGGDAFDNGSDIIAINGSSGAENITGTSFADNIFGAAGADILAGGAGNDTYNYAGGEAPAGENIIEASGSGTDTIRTSATVDLSALTVNGAADLQGASSSGIEQILIQGGTTATFSGAQLDGNTISINESTTATTTGLVINVASGANNSFANLTFAASGGGDAFDSGSDTITINGAAGAENITGTSFADTIVGGTGADTLAGGAGNDIIFGEQDDILIDGGADNDILSVSANFTSPSDGQLINIENVLLTAAATLNLTGQSENFTITGSSSADSITAGGGNDTIIGGGGADTLAGGLGNDTFTYASTAEAAAGENIIEAASGGTDTIRTTASVDLSALTVNGAADLQGSTSLGIEQILIAAGTTATFSGAQLAGNTIAINETTTGTTNLVINLAAGATSSFSGLTFAQFSGSDAFDNGADTITINGSTGAEDITGTSFNDTISGGTGVDTFRITAGTDTITDLGNGGADNIIVSSGATAIANATTGWTATATTSNAGAASVTGSGVNLSVASATGANGWTLTNSSTSTVATLTGGGNADTLVSSGAGDTINAGGGGDTVRIDAAALTSKNWTVDLGSDSSQDTIIFNHTAIGTSNETLVTVSNFDVNDSDRIAVTLNDVSVTTAFTTVTSTGGNIAGNSRVIELVNTSWVTTNLQNDGDSSTIENIIAAANFNSIPTGNYTFIIYSSTNTTTANAGIYTVNISDSSNPTAGTDMVVEHIMTLNGVGYGNLSAANFTNLTLPPAGVAGEAINLALINPADAVGAVTLTVSGVPADWSLSEGTNNGDGTWTVVTNDTSKLTVTTPGDYIGASLLSMSLAWTRVDGSTGSMSLANNVEAYAPGNPIFALSVDDNLSGSTGADMFVFADPIAHNKIFGFDTAEDKIDLVGLTGINSFADVAAHTADDASGNARIALGDGQSITLLGVHSADLLASNFVFNEVPVTNNPGSMVISNGAIMPLAGVVDNSGSIALESTGDVTTLQLIQHGMALQGGGSVTLSDSSANVIDGTVSSVTLNNVDNDISGAGQIGNGQLTLINGGTITATGVNALVIDTGDNAVINSGTIASVGSGGLLVQSVVENIGTLWANGGNLTLNGAVSGEGDAIVSGTATLTFSAAASIDTVIDHDAVATINLHDAAQFSGTLSGFNDDDLLDLRDIAFSAATTVNYAANESGTGGVLTVSDGVHSASIDMIGIYAAEDFHISADDHSGTLLRFTDHVLHV